MPPADTKMQEISERREKDLDRARWLTALAGKLLQEADELGNKWGAKNSGDATASLSPDSDNSTSIGDSGKTGKVKGKRGIESSRKATAAADITMGGTDGVPGSTPDEPVNTSKQKKPKVKKHQKGTSDTDAAVEIPKTGNPEASKSDETKPAKETKRKRASAREEVPDDAVETEGAGAAAEPPRGRHQAKDGGKKAGKSKDGKGMRVAPDATAANAVDKWNVIALEGGSARQSKFMKLLGGGKAAASSQNPDGSRAKLEVHRIQDDLQKQYDAGLRMKFEGQGQKKGLGA